MELRQVALEVARILQDAGKHALNDQMNPRDLKSFEMTDNHLSFTSDIDKRLAQFISNRITYVDVFDGFWQFRPEECHPGERYWCVGGIDGAINFVRSMPEWTITVSLFEFNDQCSAQPILSVVHAPALGLTYLAVRGSGAIRIRKTPLGDKREKWCRVAPAVRPTSSALAPPPWICARWRTVHMTRISKRICTSGTFPRFPPEPSWSGKRRGI